MHKSNFRQAIEDVIIYNTLLFFVSMTVFTIGEVYRQIILLGCLAASMLFNTVLIIRMIRLMRKEQEYTLKRLGEQLHKKELEQEKNELQYMTILESVKNPILVLNRFGDIMIINRAMRALIEVDDVIGKNYRVIFNSRELQYIIDNAQISEERYKQDLHYHNHYYAVTTSPLVDSHQEFSGNIFVFNDITKMKTTEKLQKEFVANVSHELKTPVSAIKGASELLLGGAKENPEILTEFLEIIFKENERLAYMIEDLLELSRVDSADYRMNFKTVNLVAIADECQQTFKTKLTEKEMTLVIEAEKEMVLTGDAQRLKQVFVNLISNAIKYSNPKTKITVSFKKDWQNMYVTFRDEGIGIPKKDLKHIFDRFYRVDKARSRDSGGTGLGLAIAKSIVTRHHGRIYIESQEGIGTEIFLEFPIR
ncbi:MAG: sensor histidine kinase [Culicoidibacterales bacterium]